MDESVSVGRFLLCFFGFSVCVCVLALSSCVPARQKVETNSGS